MTFASKSLSSFVTTRQLEAAWNLARKSRFFFSTTTNTMLPSSPSKTSLSTTSKTSSSLSSFSTTSSSNDSDEPPIASRRGLAAVQLLPSYLADARAVETYHPTLAPHGALQLGVAESQLVEDWLVPKLNQLAQDIPFTADCIYYQPTPGRPSLKHALAVYLQDLLQLSATVDPEGMIVGAGCNAVLENLCFTLAEPGDTVLIPTPYYAAFEFDLVARAALQITPVTTMEYSGFDCASGPIPKEAYYPTPAALDAAYDQAASKPKILLLSHPHNPLGIAYPPHVIQDCIDWCRSNKVHLISDEIYAGSVYRPDGNFTSALELAAQPTSDTGLGLGPYIHWVYALSKDFALSGLRVGVAYSENPEIRVPLQKLNDMCQISSHTQQMVEGIMTSQHDNGEPWTTAFRHVHQERLRARGDRLQALLEKYHVPYLPASCGLFCWIDLSEFLPSDGTEAERERALYLSMVKEFGLLFTPGLSMRNERPGFFRCVFSAASNDEYDLALQRLETFITTQRA